MGRRAKPDHRRAVAYLRVSTSAQDLGVEAQRTAIAGWAAREGVEVVSWHEDSGVSGGSDLDRRPALLEALTALRHHRAGLLLVAKRDRLARSVPIAATVEAAVAALGARVVAADGAGNGDGAADEFLRTILDGAAAFERRLIRDRTRAALQAKIARGERAGTVRFGWRVDPTDPRRVVEDPVEQAAIRAAVALRREGLTLREVATELDRLAYRSRGASWYPMTVARLLAHHDGRVAA